MFCFIAASLQRCLWDMAQTLHMNPLCQCRADSVLTRVGKMGELFFTLFFPRFFPPTLFPWPHQLTRNSSAALSYCIAPTSVGCSSSSVDAVAFSPLQSQHPKSQHLRLVTRACIIINKLVVQVRAHICSSTGYYREINSLAQKILNTLNRCPGSFFQGSFPALISHLPSGWAHMKCWPHFNL